jgi:hypothetical protein
MIVNCWDYNIDVTITAHTLQRKEWGYIRKQSFYILLEFNYYLYETDFDKMHIIISGATIKKIMQK